MYRDEYHPRVKKDLKKIDKPVVKHIHDDLIDAILISPHKADLLTGSLAGIYSYHFKMNRIDYRICYIIDEKEKTVYFLMIGKRENFYKLLQQRLSGK